MDEDKRIAKMELIELTNEIMPKGRPKFLEVVKYPKIETLVQEVGKAKMATVIFLMVKDFCNSLNVVRNMNEDQMIEASSMLLDECDNFRLEDYVMMFSMAKRGELVKIMDRVDIQLITSMLDEYWSRRNAVAETSINEEINHFDNLGSTLKSVDTMHPEDARLSQSASKLIAGFEAWKEILKAE